MLTFYAIYDHPKDYPNNFVVRKWVPGCGIVYASLKPVLAGSLEAARAALPKGLTQLPPHPDDDPVLVEVWV